MNKRELRFILDAEVRLAGDEQKPVITGYAAVFNKTAQIGQRFQEVIRKGTFDRALKEKQDVRALYNHDDDKVLGRTKSGTLRLSVDDKGLKYEIDPPNTTVARDLLESLRRGDVDQSSFAMVVRGQKWNEPTKDGVTTYLREITDVDLFDVGPVTYPAYDQTSAGVRSLFPDGDIEIPAGTPGAPRFSTDPDEERRLQAAIDKDWKDREELKLRLAEKL